MDSGYTYRDHIDNARRYLFDAEAALRRDDFDECRHKLENSRGSVTRAMILLPRPRDEPDAA